MTLGGGDWEIAVEEFDASRPPYVATSSFDEVLAAVATEFDAYVLWSATVSPRGFLGRESILMSKHWMDKIWSWDHCFNALARAPGLPAEAIEQYRIMFDFQDAGGALPDSVTHSEVLYNFVKPPIHGWSQSIGPRSGAVHAPDGAVAGSDHTSGRGVRPCPPSTRKAPM